MRGPTLVMLALIVLTGCSQDQAVNAADFESKRPGRYAGIGTFEPGRLWEQLAGTPASKDPQAATLADDEHIIVVLDSHTGEIRQCGDHSGVCVAMNPWSDKAAPLAVPTRLAKHAADLDAEANKTVAK